MTKLGERELWACASEVLRHNGDEAPAFVAERIGALVIAGDVAGVRTWKSIAGKVDQLQRMRTEFQ